MVHPTAWCLAVVFYCLSGVRMSLATPLPLPMPLALMAPDFSNRWLAHNLSNSYNLARDHLPIHGFNTSSGDAHSELDNSATSLSRRQYAGKIASLYGHYSNAQTHSNNLKRFAVQSATIDEEDVGFQQNAVSELKAFDSSIFGIKTILDQLGADKGLQNYDRTNDVETLLKNLVNFHKETFNAVDVLVYNIPVLGPLLGPIVYQIKCLLDDVLNAIENITDALINGLQPLLAALIGQATSTACRSGVVLLGLCV